MCVLIERAQSPLLWKKRELLCVTESIGSLFTGRQLSIRTNWDFSAPWYTWTCTHTHTLTHMHSNESQKMSFNLCTLCLHCSLYHFISFSSPFSPTTFLSPHISIFPSLFINNRNCLTIFFKSVCYLDQGVGGREFLPGSRTEGVLCWTTEKDRTERGAECGGTRV